MANIYSSNTNILGPITPATHATTHDAGGSDAMAVDAAAGTGSLRTIGTAATAACAGNDSRLADLPVASIGSGYYTANRNCTGINSSAAPTAGVIYSVPFIARRTGTVDRLACYLAGAGAGSFVRMGVYTNASATAPAPDALVTGSDAGEIDSSGAPGALVSTIGSPFTLTQGVCYWLSFICKATAPTINVLPTAGLDMILGVQADLQTINCGIYSVRAYGALPATHPAADGSLTNGSNIPCVEFRWAS